jgi:hypothetical protein
LLGCKVIKEVQYFISKQEASYSTGLPMQYYFVVMCDDYVEEISCDTKALQVVRLEARGVERVVHPGPYLSVILYLYLEFSDLVSPTIRGFLYVFSEGK